MSSNSRTLGEPYFLRMKASWRSRFVVGPVLCQPEAGFRAPHGLTSTPRGSTLDSGFLDLLWCELIDLIPQGAQVDSTRRTAFVAGVLFLITYVTAIPAAFLLYPPVLDDANYIVGAGADARVAFGALLEVLLIIANVGTAVVLFPILKRQNEALALGYVSARLVECTFIAIGIVSLLAIVMLRQDLAETGGDSGSFVTVGRSLVAIHDWMFLLGPGFVVGVGNGLILGYLMYRSGLVPRGMAMLGLIAGAVLCAAGIAVLFDVIEPGSAPQVIASAPEFVWELALGIYLTFKGFKPAPIISGLTGPAGVGAGSSAA
jgi:hypothetical protein